MLSSQNNSLGLLRDNPKIWLQQSGMRHSQLCKKLKTRGCGQNLDTPPHAFCRPGMAMEITTQLFPKVCVIAIQLILSSEITQRTTFLVRVNSFFLKCLRIRKKRWQLLTWLFSHLRITQTKMLFLVKNSGSRLKKTGSQPVSMTCGTGSLFWRVCRGCKSLWCQDVLDRQTYWWCSKACKIQQTDRLTDKTGGASHRYTLLNWLWDRLTERYKWQNLNTVDVNWNNTNSNFFIGRTQ